LNLAKNILRQKSSYNKEKLTIFKKDIKNIRSRLLYYFEIANACEIDHHVFKFEIVDELKDFDFCIAVSQYQFRIETSIGEKIVCIGFNKKSIWLDYEDGCVDVFEKLRKFKFKGFEQQEIKYICNLVRNVNICIDEIVKIIAPYVEEKAKKYIENLR
jgi:hypothetical protein